MPATQVADCWCRAEARLATVPLATDAGFLCCIIIGCQDGLQDIQEYVSSRPSTVSMHRAAARTLGVLTADLRLPEPGVLRAPRERPPATVGVSIQLLIAADVAQRLLLHGKAQSGSINTPSASSGRAIDHMCVETTDHACLIAPLAAKRPDRDSCNFEPCHRSDGSCTFKALPFCHQHITTTEGRMGAWSRTSGWLHHHLHTLRHAPMRSLRSSHSGGLQRRERVCYTQILGAIWKGRGR